MLALRIVAAGLAAVCAFPLASPFVAAAVASAHGCRLDEGGIHPCALAGADIGETLYAMFVLGWAGLVTLPVLGIVLTGWGTAEVAAWAARRRGRAARPD